MNDHYAGFWLRVVATLVDGIIILIPNLIYRAIVGDGLGTGLIWTLIVWTFLSYMESSEYQASPGKMVLGLKVTDEMGERISFGRAFGRHVAMLLSAIILLIGYMMAGWTERKQALHDIIAQTLVVKAHKI